MRLLLALLVCIPQVVLAEEILLGAGVRNRPVFDGSGEQTTDHLTAESGPPPAVCDRVGDQVVAAPGEKRCRCGARHGLPSVLKQLPLRQRYPVSPILLD